MRAAVTLMALGAVGVAGFVWTGPVKGRAVAPGHGDVAFFEAVVVGVRDGAPYYDAYGSELRRTGYPSGSAFNWRTPLLLSVVAAVPRAVPVACAVGLLAGLVVVLCRTIASARSRTVAVWVGGMMLVGALAILAVPSAVVLGEGWAGVLVGLSAWAFTGRRSGVGVLLGLAALFVRELAAPYCVVCTVVAAINRRWRELASWLAGAGAYAAYYGWHVMQVAAHRLPGDWADPSPWLGFPGLPFLMATVHWQGWLLSLPAPFTVAGLVLIVAGIASAETPVHVRTGSAAYVGFFLAAGKPFNEYWGLMAWPLWAVACGYGADTIVRAVRTLRRREAGTQAVV